MRTRAVLATLATVGVLVSGCGGTSSSAGGSDSSSGTPSGSPSRDQMSGMDMAETDQENGPSGAATMVCEEDEIRDAVKRTFRMTSDPTSTHSWSAKDRVYTCDWSVPDGTLRMTVQDGNEAAAGRAYFDRLRGSIDGATTIKGMDNFGFPAFDSSAGDVVFLKDGKTLHVDATRIPSSSLPKDFSRKGVAYSVASAVIACWTE